MIPHLKVLCTHNIFIKRFVIYCHPYMSRVPHNVSIGTLKIVAFIPYIRELSNFFLKLLPTYIHYDKKGCTPLPILLFFKSLNAPNQNNRQHCRRFAPGPAERLARLQIVKTVKNVCYYKQKFFLQRDYFNLFGRYYQKNSKV